MVPATDADKAKAQPKSGKATQPTAEDDDGTRGTVRDAPAGVTPEVQQRYKTAAVRGSPSKFDYTAYDADMKELQNLVSQVESGDINLSIAIGRIKLLSHKLGVPEPSPNLKPKPTSPREEPRAAAKPAKFSMNVRRGTDGKFAGFDVEEA
jgi:hypothetical protein